MTGETTFIAIDGLSTAGKSTAIEWIDEYTDAGTMASHPDYVKDMEREVKKDGSEETLSLHYMARTSLVSDKVRALEQDSFFKDRYILTREAACRSMDLDYSPAEEFEERGLLWPDVNFILVADDSELRNRAEKRGEKFNPVRADRDREAYLSVAEDYGGKTDIRWLNTTNLDKEEVAREIVSQVDSTDLYGQAADRKDY